MSTIEYEFPCGAKVQVNILTGLVEINLSAPKDNPHYQVWDTRLGTNLYFEGNKLTFGIFPESIPALQKLLTKVKKQLKKKK